jgi:hypothetical protein
VAIHQELEVHQPFNFHETVAPLSSFLTSKKASMQNLPLQSVEIVPIADQLEASTARVVSVQEIEEIPGCSLEGFLV